MRERKINKKDKRMKEEENRMGVKRKQIERQRKQYEKEWKEFKMPVKRWKKIKQSELWRKHLWEDRVFLLDILTRASCWLFMRFSEGCQQTSAEAGIEATRISQQHRDRRKRGYYSKVVFDFMVCSQPQPLPPPITKFHLLLPSEEWLNDFLSSLIFCYLYNHVEGRRDYWTEPVFVNVYGDQESIPRNRLRQAM